METKTPKISVIVPIYNCERFISQCLESILTQTFTDFELICVNDGSTDGTLPLLQAFEAKDERIVLVDQVNKGEGAARNAGLDRARGTFLAFFDADDFVEPQLLEHAYRKALQNKADIVIYRVDSYNQETKETFPVPWSLDLSGFPPGTVSYQDNPDRLFYAFQNWTWNKLFKASFIDECNLRFHEIQRSADLYFVCCALAKAHRIAPLDETLYHYRVGNPSSNISTNESFPLDFYLSFIKVRDYLIEEEIFLPLEKGFLNWVTGSIFFNFATLKSPEAFEELRAYLQREGCQELGLDKLTEADFFNPLDYEQLQHLLHDTSEEFLFSQLRAANRKAEEALNERLRTEQPQSVRKRLRSLIS